MSVPPGATVEVGIQPSARSVPTSTGPAFAAILTDRAPTVPKVLTSIDDWPGTRQPYSVSWDWADTYFREGGDQLTVTAVVGPAAAAATLNVPGTTGTAFTITARDKGEWANGAAGGLTAEVINGPTTGRVLIVKQAGVEIDRTPEYTTNQAAVDYLAASTVFTSAIGGGSGLTPVMAVANLAGGTIDRSNITATHLAVALAKLGSELGPGQEAAPDYTTDSGRTALRASAAQHNRFAVLDLPDTTVKATLTAAAAALFGGTGSDSCALYGPWLNVPALASGGTDRAVPASALVCARMATNDATPGLGPAQSPMGAYGAARYATGVRAAFSRDTILGVNDAGDLNDAGVNLVIMDGGVPTIYGLRTLVSQTGPLKQWGQVGVVRHRMSLLARGLAHGARYVGAKANRRSIEALELDLSGMLLDDYLNGDLFGDLDDDRPQTAYRVDVDTPNSTVNLNAGKLGADMYYRPVKGAELVPLRFIAVPVTEPVS